MKTRRITKWCLECLENEDMDTEQIKDYINSRSRHGATSHGLANVLGRDKRFSLVGRRYLTRRECSYKVAIWSLSGACTTELKEITEELKKESKKDAERKREESDT